MPQARILLELARLEIGQRREEGCDVEGLAEELERLEGLPPVELAEAIEALWARLEHLESPLAAREPSVLDDIRASRTTQPPEVMREVFSVEDLRNRTLGGWLGRCAGCLLGKPVEGWSREKIREVATLDDNVPLRDYFAPLTRPVAGRRFAPGDPSLKGSIRGMARDDDIDYTILNLLLLERHGFGFSTGDVAGLWLGELPFHQVYTAERVAYRNLVNGISPEIAGGFRNPCREWIGAQIRADAFGYVCPGRPEKAAELAWRDAWLSHRANGVYGAMFVAAMIAAAFCEPDIRRVIEVGLGLIPPSSRLAQAVRNVVGWWERYGDWVAVAEEIDRNYGDLQGCHVVTNAAVVALGLLASGGDFSEGIAVAVMTGYDTDCNGATVGSILGVRNGAAALPARWVEPLGDTVFSALTSVGTARISDLAERTVGVTLRGLADEDNAQEPGAG